MSDLFTYLDEGQNIDLVEATPPQPEVLTVTQISNRLRLTVEKTFASIAIEGEVSGLKKAASGHVYFSLKDDENVLSAIIWRSTASRLSTPIEEGMHITAYGKLTTYGARSNYQMIVERVEIAGEGALAQRFEALKAKLAAEGLFDAHLKQPLPYYPKTVGIITSPTGAVIEDMRNRLRLRAPTHTLLWPVAVQGAGAHLQIIEAIKGFNALPANGPIPKPEVLIVARGGGSLEDLWPFNEELLVRAVAASKIPVISGVGHEPDVTLCDYSADHRSPTPTAAAIEALPDMAELLQKIENSKATALYFMRQRLKFARQHVLGLKRALPDPKNTLNQVRLRLEDKTHRLRSVMGHYLALKKQKIQTQHQALILLKPTAPLEKGFVYLTNTAGKLISSAKTKEVEVTAHFKDGSRTAVLKAE